MESFKNSFFKKYFPEINFIQDNESKSEYGVLRGIHFQMPPFAQTKLVRVIDGKVLDVAVDLRSNSPMFGKYFSIILSGENKKQFLIPKGFGHGFLVLSKTAIFSYKVDNYYDQASDRRASGLPAPVHHPCCCRSHRLCRASWSCHRPSPRRAPRCPPSKRTMKLSRVLH